MKIAIFIKNTTLHDSFGGLETQNKILCEGLALMGHEVFVFSPKKSLTKLSEDLNNVHYVFVESDIKSRFGLGFLNKKNWLNRSFDVFSELHKKINFDIIVGQSSGALGVIKRKNIFNIPVISIAHGTIIGEFKTQLQNLNSLKSYMKLPFDLGYVVYNFFGRQREFINHSDHIIAVSNAVKQAIIDETFVPENKVTVVFNGINSSSIKPKLNYDNNSLIKIVYVGRVEESKGIGDLIKAFSKLQNKSNAKLTIVGDGPYLAKAKKLTQELNLTGKILLTGKMAHEEVSQSLSTYDVFVLPSRRYEGFPMTIVEAMFAGLPVIGAEIGGITEAVKDKITGRTYKSGNIDELATLLLELCQNAPLRQSFGIAGLDYAKENFSLEKMLNMYLKIFEKETK